MLVLDTYALSEVGRSLPVLVHQVQTVAQSRAQKTVCRRCLLAIYYQFGDGALAARFVPIVVQTAARFRAQLWPVLQCVQIMCCATS